MKPMNTLRRQRGVTLVVGLIMLVLITLVVTTAFMLSNTNLKAVGNMQFREEAIAAANAAIEEVISSDDIFFAPAATTIEVAGYTVNVAAPVCLYAVDVSDKSGADPNPNILIEGGGGGAGGGATGFQDTYWDITASVDDDLSGASVETHQGIKITLPGNPNPCP
jgi:hypothetical protein